MEPRSNLGSFFGSVSCAVSLSQNVRTGNEIQGSTVNLGFEPFQSGTPISAAPQPSG